MNPSLSLLKMNTETDKKTSSPLQSFASRLTRFFRRGKAESEPSTSVSEQPDPSKSEEIVPDIEEPSVAPTVDAPVETVSLEPEQAPQSEVSLLTPYTHPAWGDGSPDIPTSNEFNLEDFTTKRRVHLTDLTAEEARVMLQCFMRCYLSDENLGVEFMAAHLKMSRTGLYALVHEAFDMTPANYILQCRLERAVELLDQGKKVREVSFRCGFSDPKYFSKVFRKYKGVLPSAYNNHS